MSDDNMALEADLKAIREAYDALNRYDVPAFVRMFDPQVERVEHFPGGSTCHGLEALKAHVELHRGNWAEGSCEPRRFVVAGDKVVVYVHVQVRLDGETDWREGDVSDGFAFRGGKATEFHTFLDRQQAMDWAGVADPGGH